MLYWLNSSPPLRSFQSTHPHGMRHNDKTGEQSIKKVISIHASTWDATSACGSLTPGVPISIHASTWDATHSLRSVLVSTDFNPRIHMGCDANLFQGDWEGLWISIHASTWDATCRYSNTFRMLSFQSTHPHGMRLGYILFFSEKIDFNPRIHMGCDSPTILNVYGVLSFQSTHPHGMRQTMDKVMGVSQTISIHASTWDATRQPACDRLDGHISIHASTWDATPSCLVTHTMTGFQSTHPHGMRPTHSTTTKTTVIFQSTHPHGMRRPTLRPC
ncbi:hypothetical protein SAMN05518684_1155 [Salipaludibacillus aurantiacus]|uniref:Uncharacterized protein n=1 Tax=Salipaludibacillus aurantiacus TaxID=1601833 RepID=A0A1H9W843_9BACI|nr:hypothetical protein SAMN05518684_1155 [Salipaludibacillus aurantiacus]